MSLALTIALYVLGIFALVVTALPLLSSDVWWVRSWEFPRVQIAVLAAATATAIFASGHPPGTPGTVLAAALLAATVYQIVRIIPYTPVGPKQVEDAGSPGSNPSLTVMMSNVLMTNREAAKLIGLVHRHQPDILLTVETDAWWQEALAPLTEQYSHQVAVPQDDTYGMLLFSRHPLTDTSIEYLVTDFVPSIHTTVALPGSPGIRFHAVHPEPPSPTEADDTTERDAEILLVGRRTANPSLPTIVAGDLNDVAWSPTTSLFQKTSHLLDPRKGRGLYSTFHASYFFLRWPLDHLFHSDHFTLIGIQRLPHIGSDHFPILVQLSLEPGAPATQSAPETSPEEERQATQKILAANPS